MHARLNDKLQETFALNNFYRNCRPTSVAVTAPSENSFIKKLKSSGRSLVVFYGSQTGTAEEFAGRLAKEGIRYKLKGMVADPEECDMVTKIAAIIINLLLESFSIRRHLRYLSKV